MKCPCNSDLEFGQCCEPYLQRQARPETAEKLMRSRYTAYTRGDVVYIKETIAPESLADFDEEATRRWAEDSKWLGLAIHSTENGGPEDKKGVVTFTARFEQNGEKVEHRERSTFRKDATGGWLFVDGELPAEARPKPLFRASPKVGRNDPCPCGSGLKFKKCCA